MTPEITAVVPSEIRVKTLRRGRPFVNTKQRFVALFGTQKSWLYVMACIALIGFAFAGLSGILILSLQQQLSQRQVVIVGETTAKQLVPLWPNGVGSNVCDSTCMEGSLESFIPAFRCISGEPAGPQPIQHDCAAKTAAFIARGSPAATVIDQYNTRYPAYDLAAKGVVLQASRVTVQADHMLPNQYVATWTDTVSNARTHESMGSHSFSARITAHADSSARTEDSIKWNPGGVLISDIYLQGDQ